MKIVVGLSGGVDSAVAAFLLKQSGNEIICVTMKNLEKGQDSSVADAARVAEFLGAKHIVRDVCSEFKDCVMGYFADEYLNCRTPNPCVMCNRFMKWNTMMDVMQEQGAEMVATGHYADIVRLDNGRYTLKKNAGGKDQTYALSFLTQEQLSRTVMPLAMYDKERVRSIAADNNLPVAYKADSQDICFVPDGEYTEFIKEFSSRRIPGEGDFVDEKGNKLGHHKGVIFYTVGQRKGLGLSLNRPVFVKELRPDTNEVVISTEGDVFTDHLYCNRLNMFMENDCTEGVRLTAKVRYADKGSSCRVFHEADDVLRVEFDGAVRAVTPGQIVAFYDDDLLYGAATILHT